MLLFPSDYQIWKIFLVNLESWEYPLEKFGDLLRI